MRQSHQIAPTSSSASATSATLAYRNALRHPPTVVPETPECLFTEKDETTGSIIQLAIDIHRSLGRAHLPEVYRNAMAIELTRRDYHIRKDMDVPIYYREFLVGQGSADLVVADYCLITILSDAEPDSMYQSVRQLKSLLKASGYSVGLVLNFGQPRMVDGIRRVTANVNITTNVR